MSDKYWCLTIWVTEFGFVYKSTVADLEKFPPGRITWSKIKDGDFYRSILGTLAADGWRIESTSAPDEHGITRFIFYKLF